MFYKGIAKQNNLYDIYHVHQFAKQGLATIYIQFHTTHFIEIRVFIYLYVRMWSVSRRLDSLRMDFK